MNEDVSPIKQLGDFPASHAGFSGCIFRLEIHGARHFGYLFVKKIFDVPTLTHGLTATRGRRWPRTLTFNSTNMSPFQRKNISFKRNVFIIFQTIYSK